MRGQIFVRQQAPAPSESSETAEAPRRPQPELKETREELPRRTNTNLRETKEDLPGQAAQQQAASARQSAPEKVMPAKAAPRVGRNDPCPCGSGKKYKNCHGRGL